MKKINRVLIFITGTVFLSGLALAQYDPLENIKVEAVELLKENKKLEAQYRALQERAQDLYLAEDLRKPLLEESQNTYMQGQVIDTDEAKSLWKLQLADLQYQKRELQMELEDKKTSEKSSRGEYDQKLNVFKKELQVNRGKEKKLLDEIAAVEGQENFSLEQIEQIRQKNQALEAQIIVLEKKKDFKIRENAHLENKRLLLNKTFEGNFWDQEWEKSELDFDVRELEAEYRDLDDVVKMSLTRERRKEKLLQQIHKVEQDNGILRKRLADLQKNTK